MAHNQSRAELSITYTPKAKRRRQREEEEYLLARRQREADESRLQAFQGLLSLKEGVERGRISVDDPNLVGMGVLLGHMAGFPVETEHTYEPHGFRLGNSDVSQEGLGDMPSPRSGQTYAAPSPAGMFLKGFERKVTPEDIERKRKEEALAGLSPEQRMYYTLGMKEPETPESIHAKSYAETSGKEEAENARRLREEEIDKLRIQSQREKSSTEQKDWKRKYVSDAGEFYSQSLNRAMSKQTGMIDSGAAKLQAEEERDRAYPLYKQIYDELANIPRTNDPNAIHTKEGGPLVSYDEAVEWVKQNTKLSDDQINAQLRKWGYR